MIRPATPLLAVLFSLAAPACGDPSDDGPPASGTTGTTGATEATGATTDAADPPQILEVAVEPVAENPLAVRVRIAADRPVEATVTVVPTGAPADAAEGTVAAAGLAEEHRVPVVGLHADAGYRFDVEVRDAQGATATASVDHTTAPLDPALPPLAVAGTSGEPGTWTFFNVMRWLGPGLDPGWGAVVAVDGEGHPVWLRILAQAGDVAFGPDGTIAVQVGTETAVVLDRTGATVAEYRAPDLVPPIDTMHHEIAYLPGGRFATLSSELRTVDGYDDGMGGTTAYDVVADVLAEFDADGNTVWALSLFDAMSAYVHRVRPGFHAPFWDPVYADQAPSGTTKDWTHGNAMVYTDDGSRVLVSLRTQDWIVTFDRASGELLHRLGPEGDFTLVEGDWFYHQHAPELLPDGGIAVYDNGNTRPGTGGPGEPPPYSRIAVYDVDETTMEVREVFSHVAEGGAYAPFLGDVDLRPDGSWLVTDGGLVSDPGLLPNDPANQKFARISEVAPDGTVRFRLDVGGPDAGTSFSVYRAERVGAGYDFAVAPSGRSTRRPRQ